MLSASTTAFSSSTATNLPAWMIGHGIGVSIKETYHLKRGDMDYFTGKESGVCLENPDGLLQVRKRHRVGVGCLMLATDRVVGDRRNWADVGPGRTTER